MGMVHDWSITWQLTVTTFISIWIAQIGLHRLLKNHEDITFIGVGGVVRVHLEGITERPGVQYIV